MSRAAGGVRAGRIAGMVRGHMRRIGLFLLVMLSACVLAGCPVFTRGESEGSAPTIAEDEPAADDHAGHDHAGHDHGAGDPHAGHGH